MMEVKLMVKVEVEVLIARGVVNALHAQVRKVPVCRSAAPSLLEAEIIDKSSVGIPL